VTGSVAGQCEGRSYIRDRPFLLHWLVVGLVVVYQSATSMIIIGLARIRQSGFLGYTSELLG